MDVIEANGQYYRNIEFAMNRFRKPFRAPSADYSPDSLNPKVPYHNGKSTNLRCHSKDDSTHT